MAARKRRKKDKLRGQRTHGKGNTKNKRGAGSRGGRGRAGSHKHKYSKYYKTFGGKKQMKPRKKTRALNLGELNSVLEGLVEKKRAEVKGDEIFIDGKISGIEKILSRGKIERKIVLKNIRASRKALEKIKMAGGRIEEPVKETGEGAKEGRPTEKTEEEQPPKEAQETEREKEMGGEGKEKIESQKTEKEKAREGAEE